MQINYKATEPGVLYWVEETTSRILVTQSMKADETIEQSVDDSEPLKEWGIDPTMAKFTLYFVPEKDFSDR